MIRSSIVRSSIVTAVLSSISLLAACSSAEVEDVGVVDSPAKIKGDKTDCFASCKQEDWTKLAGKDEAKVKTACADLLKELQGLPNKWDPAKEICIGFDNDIKDIKDCNRFRLPKQNDCKNQLMLLCSKRGEPGFGKIRPVPPKGPVPPGGSLPGFPPPRPGKPPGVTDQETACIAQWKCPNTLTTFKSVGIRPAAVATAVATDAVCVSGDEASCGECLDWVVPYAIPEDALLPDPTLQTEVP